MRYSCNETGITLLDPTTGATQYSAIGIVPLQELEGIALPDPHMDNRFVKISTEQLP